MKPIASKIPGWKQGAVVVLSVLLWWSGLHRAEAGENSWTPIGPEGRNVPSLATDPGTAGTVYACSDQGLLRTTDGGGSWSAVGPCTRVVAVDPSNPSRIYTVATGGGVFRSVDSGATWATTNLTNPHINALAIDPKIPDTLYAGIGVDYETRDRIFKSVDGGSSWTPLTGGPPWAEINDLAIDPRTPDIVYAGAFGGGVFKTTDGGATWNAVNEGLIHLGVEALAIDPKTPTTLYVAMTPGGSDNAGGGVFKSVDGGATWSATGFPNVHLNTLVIDPKSPTTLYAAGFGDGVFKSTDGGATSSPLNDGLSGASVFRMIINPHDPMTLYAGTYYAGIFTLTLQDTTPPAAAVASPGDGATVSGTINVTMNATDDVAVTGVQLLLDGAPLGPEDTWAPYETPWDTRMASDGTHHLQARARDAAGNLGLSAEVTVSVANGPVPSLAVARTEESGAVLSPCGAWTVIGNDDVGVKMSGSQAVYAGDAGATATFSFTGTGVRWIGFPCERCGIADVLIDGTRVATVDSFGPSRPEFSKVMYTSPTLSAGSHTIAIAVTGVANGSSGGPFVVVDAFDVMLDNAGLVPLVPSIPPVSTPLGL